MVRDGMLMNGEDGKPWGGSGRWDDIGEDKGVYEENRKREENWGKVGFYVDLAEKKTDQWDYTATRGLILSMSLFEGKKNICGAFCGK